MANLGFNRVQAREKEVKIVAGKFKVGVSGSVEQSTGYGMTPSLSASGVYNLALEDKYPSLLAYSWGVEAASPSPISVQLGADNVSSSGSLTLHTISGAALSQPASGTVVHVTLHLKNTSVAR